MGFKLQTDRAAENCKEPCSVLTFGDLVLNITKTVLPEDQDGGGKRPRGGEVYWKEMQTGQHVQPHGGLLPSRDCRWYKSRCHFSTD